MLQRCLTYNHKRCPSLLLLSFFNAHAIPFHFAHSPYFKQMLKDVIVVGSSFVLLGENKLCIKLLDRGYCKLSVLMKEMKQTWINDGCFIIVDGWTDIKHWPLFNIIVTSSASFYLREEEGCKLHIQILNDSICVFEGSNVVHVVIESTHVFKLAWWWRVLTSTFFRTDVVLMHWTTHWRTLGR